jgi:hypothetical protein
MKKNEVKVGQCYRVKVNHNIAEVRITGENPYGGWDGVNVATNRGVRIKTAQRLQGLVSRPAKRTVARTMEEAQVADADTTTSRVMTKAEYEAQAATPAADVGAGAEIPVQPEPTAKGRPRRAKGEDGAKRPSGLDAAAAVLAEAGKPMNANEMVDRMLSTGMWKTGGKTPASTIYAAIIREISIKGDQARFRKVERGKFTLAK